MVVTTKTMGTALSHRDVTTGTSVGGATGRILSLSATRPQVMKQLLSRHKLFLGGHTPIASGCVAKVDHIESHFLMLYNQYVIHVYIYTGRRFM